MLDRNVTFAIGLLLDGADGSSPGCLMIGVMMDRFCEDGRTPSRRDVLHSRVRNGRRMSIDSWMRHGGRGANSDDLGGEEKRKNKVKKSCVGMRGEGKESRWR